MYINEKKLKVRRYSSGELKLVKSELDKYIFDNAVEIIYMNEFSFFELVLIVKYYLSKGVKVDLILSYLPYQRMDHKDRDELDTVTFVGEILNELNLNSLMVCEPHCNINFLNKAKQTSLIEPLKNMVFNDIGFDETKDCVVLTDKGGVKRYQKYFKNTVYFEKERDLETGLIIKHKMHGNINHNGKAVIVDDIISTGDTIVNIIEELSKMNIKEIYVMVGHIENNKYNKRIFEYDNVIKGYSSNALKKNGHKKLKLINIKDLIRRL